MLTWRWRRTASGLKAQILKPYCWAAIYRPENLGIDLHQEFMLPTFCQNKPVSSASPACFEWVFIWVLDELSNLLDLPELGVVFLGPVDQDDLQILWSFKVLWPWKLAKKASCAAQEFDGKRTVKKKTRAKARSSLRFSDDLVVYSECSTRL